jgi:hypothetical protein
MEPVQQLKSLYGTLKQGGTLSGLSRYDAHALRDMGSVDGVEVVIHPDREPEQFCAAAGDGIDLYARERAIRFFLDERISAHGTLPVDIGLLRDPTGGQDTYRLYARRFPALVFPAGGAVPAAELAALQHALDEDEFHEYVSRVRARTAEADLPHLRQSLDLLGEGEAGLRTVTERAIATCEGTLRAHAERQVRDAVDAANAAHPELQITYGYIGNFERWGDDRSLRVWIKGADGEDTSCLQYEAAAAQAMLDAIRSGAIETFIAANYTPDGARKERPRRPGRGL